MRDEIWWPSKLKETNQGICPSHNQVVRGSAQKSTDAQVLGKQLLRSGTSVGAHYREGCRAKSNADFISKIEGGLQELDETLYWLELLAEANIISASRLEPLERETNELIAMFVTMARGVKQRKAGVVIPHPSALIP